jgi:hypothetical protein
MIFINSRYRIERRCIIHLNINISNKKIFLFKDNMIGYIGKKDDDLLYFEKN